jgi:hypothetical protein
VGSQQLLQLSLYCLFNQSSGPVSEQLRHRIYNLFSTFKLNNIILIHGGVSPQVVLMCRNYKSTRYAAFFQLFKHQIWLYLWFFR